MSPKPLSTQVYTSQKPKSLPSLLQLGLGSDVQHWIRGLCAIGGGAYLQGR